MVTSDTAGRRLDHVGELADQIRQLFEPSASDVSLQPTLAGLGRFAEADRAYAVREDGGHWVTSDEWCAPGIAPMRTAQPPVRTAEVAWWTAVLARGETIQVDGLHPLPASAEEERELLERRGARAALAVAVRTGGRTVGFVGLDRVRGPEAFDTPTAQLAALVAAVVAARGLRADAERRHQTLAERAWRLQHADLLGRVARGAAVDLKNRLAVAATVAGEMLDVLRGPPDVPRLRDAAQRIATAAADGRSLVERFLSAAEPGELAPRVVDLSAAVLDLQDVLRATLDERTTLRLDLTEEPCHAVVDRNALDEAIVELVANARAAMRRGGTITLRTHCEQDGPRTRAVLEVIDQGDGLTPEVRGRAFEAFFTTRAPEDGLGLGLARVRRFAEQSGGEAALLDGVPNGARARIALPGTDAPAEPLEWQGAPAPGRGEHVLVVEDDGMLRDTLRRLLEGHGYEVVHAGDALEALALAESASRLDLLVTDLRLPVGSGASLAQSLRRRRPTLPVVLISARSGDPTEGAVAPPVRYLAKPFGRTELLGTVRQILDTPR